MRIGFVELVLLLFIASITVGPNVALFADRWLRRAQRTSAAAARRKAQLEAQAAIEREALMTRFRVASNIFALLMLAALAYGLLLRPIDTPPKVYTAPDVRQDTGAAQTALSADSKDSWKLGGYLGVDCVRTQDGLVYAAAYNGAAMKKRQSDLVRTDGGHYAAILSVEGELTSFAFDADGDLWLTVVTSSGGALCRARHDSWGTSVEQVVTQIDGAPLGVLSAVETGPDGKVYFAVSSEAAAKNGLESALRTELIAHTGTGCVYVYDPSARTVEQVLGGVAGAAGLALSEDDRTLYVSDLGNRCIWSVDADARELTAGGKNCGSFVSGLPGYPGALALDEDGTLYISYRWTRSGWLEKHADSTLLRGIALRAGENIQKKLFKLPADAPLRRGCGHRRRKLEADILRQRAGRLHGGVPGGKQSVFRRGRLCQPAVCKSIKRGVFYDGRVQKANRDRSATGCDGAAGPGKAEKGRCLCGGLLVQRDRRRPHRQGLEP